MVSLKEMQDAIRKDRISKLEHQVANARTILNVAIIEIKKLKAEDELKREKSPKDALSDATTKEPIPETLDTKDSNPDKET